MTVAELIERLQAIPGDLPVILMYDRIGCLPLEEVRQLGRVTTVVQEGGFIELSAADRAKAKLECTLIARVPVAWLKRWRRAK